MPVRKYSDEERKLRNKESRLRWMAKPESKLKQAAYATKRRKRNPELRMFDCARYRAKRKGLEFSISIEDIIIPEMCPIFLTRLKLNNTTLKGDSATLDRVDSSKGYIPGNVKVISHKANSCKSDMSIESITRLLNYMENNCNT